MPREAHAAAYADAQVPAFMSRYMEFARTGRFDAIPGAIRYGFMSYMDPLDAFCERRAAEEPDAGSWVWTLLYRAKLRGETVPVPGGSRAVSVASSAPWSGVWPFGASIGRLATRR